MPLTVAPSAFDQVFRLKDSDGYWGKIDGVPSMYAVDQAGIIHIDNTTLKPVPSTDTGGTNYIKSIVSDTIQGDWFTIINEEKRQLRIILDKNEESKTRFLNIYVWTNGNPQVADKGIPLCGNLEIFQKPSEDE